MKNADSIGGSAVLYMKFRMFPPENDLELWFASALAVHIPDRSTENLLSNFETSVQCSKQYIDRRKYFTTSNNEYENHPGYLNLKKDESDEIMLFTTQSKIVGRATPSNNNGGPVYVRAVDIVEEPRYVEDEQNDDAIMNGYDITNSDHGIVFLRKDGDENNFQDTADWRPVNHWDRIFWSTDKSKSHRTDRLYTQNIFLHILGDIKLSQL